ncbi:MAG TPA: stage II sporulation protein M [Burkholderiaceae bacterium]|nr:stage II sporulation protein M [Burkholderiaceae bacterium]
MKQKLFETEHAQLWQDIDAILRSSALGAEELPAYYRRLCQCLALAQQRGYSPALTDYLQKLVVDCHKRLYGTAIERPRVLRAWLLQDLPRRVREEWRLLLVATLAFWGVAAALGLLVWWKPYWAYSFLSPMQLNKMHSMYQPGNISMGRGGSEGDLAMFGFYIWNNVSICFRTFAAGIFGGVLALVSLIFNGMNLGVVASWLSQTAATRGTFWPFVATHSSFEITGLMLSGVAGMRLGLALIHPGRLSRRHALQAASQRMFPILVGAALLTVLAAFFEAFWSANTAIPVTLKFTVAAVCWLSVFAYFGLVGRGRR